MQPEDAVNVANKNSRVVVLKHMFTLRRLDEDASLLLDLKEDVREECASLGEVTNVVLYDVSWVDCCRMCCLSWRSLLEGARRRDDGQVSRSYQRSSLRGGACSLP